MTSSGMVLAERGIESYRLMRTRWWLWPTTVYLGTRLLNALMILVASQSQLDHASYPVHAYVADVPQAEPGYFRTATNWDGQWYAEIAHRGYPGVLPRDEDGEVGQSAWAFFPLYPLLARIVMMATGLDFAPVAVTISLLSGLAGCLLVYRLVGLGQSRFVSRVAVLGVCTFTAAPALQIAYTEGLALLLVAATLWSIVRSKHLATGLLLLALGLTRPIALPMALVLAVWGVVQWRGGLRDIKTTSTSAALTIWAVICSLLWPLIAGIVTGEADAYRLTQAAWGNGVLPPPVLFVMTRSPDLGGLWVATAAAVFIAVTVLGLASLGSNHLVMRAWCFGYCAYILAVARWEVTSVRYFLLAIPVFWTLAQPAKSLTESRVHRGMIVVLAVIGLATQWLWIRYAVTFAADRYMYP